MSRMPDPRAGMPGPGVPPPRQAGPYGPPGYGAPPGWAGPPPGIPPQRKGSKRVAVIIVLAVALVGAAGGIWYFTQGGDSGQDTPAPKDYAAAVEDLGAAEVAWQVTQGPAPGVSRADHYWTTDKNLVRRLPGRVVAYDLKSGDVAWEFAIDGPAEDDCRSSREHSKNRVALLRRGASDDTCGKLTVLDIGTGKEVLTTELQGSDGSPPEKGEKKAPEGPPLPDRVDTPVTFGERVVIPGASVRVHDITTGAALRTPLAGGECEVRQAGAFGDMLLADYLCDIDESGRTEEVGRLRAFDANLNPMWEWALPPNENGYPLPVLGVLSVDPLVIEVGSVGHKPELMRLDPASGNTVRINGYEGGGGAYLQACDGMGLSNCLQVKVVDDKLVLMTIMKAVNPDHEDAAPGAEATDHRNELVAFDLNTGEEAWRTGIEAGRLLSLVPTATAELVAFQPANLNGGKAIVYSVDPGTGKLKPLMPIGPKAHEDDQLSTIVTAFGFGGQDGRAVWQDGVLVIFEPIHRGADVGEAETVAFALSN